MENNFDSKEKALELFEAQSYNMLLATYKWDGISNDSSENCTCNTIIAGVGWSRACKPVSRNCDICFCHDNGLFIHFINKYRVELAKAMIKKYKEIYNLI